MKTISTMMMKGGSGKTTLTRVLATAALSKKMKVHIIDMDTDPQAIDWQHRFETAPWGKLKKPSWPSDQLTISGPPTTLEALYDTLEEKERDGYDLVLLDTRPGAHQDTEDLILTTDLTLIPTRPEQADFKKAEQTVEWFGKIVETLEDKSEAPELRTVLTAVQSKMMSVLVGELDIETLNPRDQEVLEAVTSLPHAMTIIPHSKYWTEIAAWGPLNVAAEAAASQPYGRLQANNMRDLIESAEALLDELLACISETEDA